MSLFNTNAALLFMVLLITLNTNRNANYRSICKGSVDDANRQFLMRVKGHSTPNQPIVCAHSTDSVEKNHRHSLRP